MKTAHRILFLASLLSISTGIASAQSTVATGTPPFNTFAGGPIDIVNVGTANVHLTIPILHKPGRGVPVDVALTYDNSIWSVAPSGAGAIWTLRYTTASDALNRLGWYFRPLGYISGSAYIVQTCGTMYFNTWVETGWVLNATYTYYDPSQTPHSFPGTVTIYTGTCGSSYSGSPGTAQDGSGYVMVVDSSGNITVIGRNGQKVYWALPSGGDYAAPVATDNNGNQISISSSGAITDTLGQTAFTMSGSGPITLTYTAPNGQPAPYTVKYTGKTVKTNFGCIGISEYGPTAQSLVTEIDLPDQAVNPSSKYTFSYETTPGDTHSPPYVTGRLASVTLPTGGTIYYTYSGGSNGIDCGFFGYTPTLTRTTPDGTWTYARLGGTTTVTDPQGNQTVANFSGGLYETQRRVYQGSTSGTLLQTVYTCYNGSALPCNSGGPPFTQKSVFTQWPNGQESESITNYNYPYTEVTEQDEYDYGSGAPSQPMIRKTLTTYATLGNGIIDRPSQVSVYDGSNNLKAQTTYSYDGSSPVSSGITTQHIAVSGSRGNPTTVTRLVSGSTTVSQTYTYFDTGMVNVAKDPKLNPTTYVYSLTYQGAYPTTITNALNQTTTNAYNIYTGQLTSTTDPNNQTISYTYDSMLRPLSVSYPDGGQTTYSYPNPNEEDLSQKITSSTNRTSSLLVDGLGREIRRIVSNGEATPYDQIDTCYDALGRIGFTSYPYQGTGLSGSPCPSSRPGDSFTYDGLGRTKTVTHSDGSIISTSYVGNTATVTDEQSKTRQSFADGLGRLTQVIENPGGLNYSTTYTYDALDNLTSVLQAGSRQRTFVYDSLSRLTSSTNPESGTTAYTYDADGNVATKTDARNITASYTYDALNRLTQVDYSDGTASEGYVYDTAHPWGTSLTMGNPVGRLVGVSANGSTAGRVFGYDPMGRINQRRDCILSLACDYTLTQYNFLGNPTQITYPTGLNLNYTYNVGNRPTSAIDSNSVSYVTNAHYNAAGSPCSEVLGSAITQTWTFNTRLQPLRTQATTSGAPSTPCAAPTQTGNLLDLSYNFNLGSGDNGNVMGITNNRDATRSQTFAYDALNRLLTAQTTSTYATSPAHCWGEGYVYDNNPSGGAWGNLTNINVASTAYNGCTQENLSVTASPQNRISTSGYSYDAAGNMTAVSGSSYTYNAKNQIASTAGVTYTYEPFGARVAKSNGTMYWYGPTDQMLEESNLSGALTNFYVYFGGQRVARVDSSNNVFYYVTDHLGTSRVIVPSGQSTPCYDADFYPFGGERAYTNTCAQNYKFTGKERDSESNLDNFGARYDSSSMGRFMSPDPLMASAKVWDPQTWNRYSYALNNPLMFIDPTGMHEVTAAQCALDPRCVTINVNVIYDKNSNEGKGLTDKQKADFEKGQLQNAKDEYGNADIHLNVTYTAGALTVGDNGKAQVSGAQAGALNVVVTDQVTSGKSTIYKGIAYSFVNPNSNDLPHEMAHQFMGDTQGWRNFVMTKDQTMMGATTLNAITDIGNDFERAWMRTLDSHSGPFSHYPLASAFNRNAEIFQKRIQPTTKPQ